jgi:hypothetical protein
VLQPSLSEYLLPDGRRRGFRTRPFFCPSTAAQLEPLGRFVDRRTEDGGRYEVLDRWYRDRLNWASARRLRASVRAGFAERPGERGRWLRVSQRGVTVTTLARRWSAFARDHLRPAIGEFDWLRVTGMTASGIPHVHVVWFGSFIHQGWLQDEWGNYTDGDGIAWCAEVKGQGPGVAKYLSKQFVEYLSGQGVRARWSTSRGWLRAEPGDEARPTASGRDPVGASALRFLRSSSYQGHDGPVPAVYVDRVNGGVLRSSLPLGELLAWLR